MYQEKIILVILLASGLECFFLQSREFRQILRHLPRFFDTDTSAKISEPIRNYDPKYNRKHADCEHYDRKHVQSEFSEQDEERYEEKPSFDEGDHGQRGYTGILVTLPKELQRHFSGHNSQKPFPLVIDYKKNYDNA